MTTKEMVMVVHTNKNGKLKFRVCESMETAKRLFPNDQKQIVQCFLESDLEKVRANNE